LFLNINNLNINYHVSGKGKNVILLHGWGTKISFFESVHQHLEKYFRVYSIDFPGFGQSDPPDEPWGTEEYTQVLRQFLNDLKIDNPILFGHSFGGKVAIHLAVTEKVNKIILIDSAGIKAKRGFQYYLKVYSYKLSKKIAHLPFVKNYAASLVEVFKKKAGSEDYQNASGVMRATLVKVVNEDFRHLLPKIQVPTLLVWGENDEATPVSDGQLMEKLIPDAGLVILKNAGHFSYLEKRDEFLIIITNFLKNDMREIND
jgi:pimeloyl-ACP methyl ester carboxylesterase